MWIINWNTIGPVAFLSHPRRANSLRNSEIACVFVILSFVPGSRCSAANQNLLVRPLSRAASL
jgi:hypothetical protein